MKTKELKHKFTKISAIIYDINEALINEEIDALEAYIYFDRLQKLTGDLMKGYKEKAINQAWATSDENEFEMYGSKIQKRQGSARWDFKGCPTWATKKHELSAIEKDLKHAHALYERGANIADADGVEHEIPVKKFGDDTIAIVHFDKTES